MITFLVKKGKRYTLLPYLNSERAAEFKDQIRVLNYTQIHRLLDEPSHLIVFSDHEQFTSKEKKALIRIWKHFKEKYPQLSIWNEPGKVLSRLELIQKLFESNLNHYNAYRIDSDLSGIRFPVFVRSSYYHNGSLTGLIYNESDLRSEIKRISFPRNKYYSKDLMIVEFCDISEDNKYKKYSTLRLNGVEIPILMDISKNWIVKTDLRNYDTDFCEKILDFVRTNPHRDHIARVFNMANIDYGRIDYSVKDDKPQIWEINSNPVIMWPAWFMEKLLKSVRPEIIPYWTEFKKIVYSQMTNQFRAILRKEPVQVTSLAPNSRIHLYVSNKEEKIKKQFRFTISSLVKRLSNNPQEP